MSTITATPVPAPSIGKAPLVIGIAVVGVVAAAVVAVPRIATTTESAPAVSAAPLAGGPDALEAHQQAALARAGSGGLDVIERAGIAARVGAERSLDGLAKSQGNYAGLTVSAAARAVPASVIAAQVGGLHRTYAFSGSTGYSSLVDEQVPGSGGRLAVAEHTVWNDSFVPPYQDPTWAEAFQRHYFGTRPAS